MAIRAAPSAGPASLLALKPFCARDYDQRRHLRNMSIALSHHGQRPSSWTAACQPDPITGLLRNNSSTISWLETRVARKSFGRIGAPEPEPRTIWLRMNRQSALPRSPQQGPVSTLSHRPCIADQSPNPRAQRIGNASPFIGHAPRAEQGRGNFTLTCTLHKSVMHTQHVDTARDTRVMWKQGRREMAMATKREKSPQRQDQFLRRSQAIKPVLEPGSIAPCKMALGNIETDVMPAVGKKHMLPARRPDRDRQPRREITQHDPVLLWSAIADDRDWKNGGIERSTPDHPGLWGRAIGIFSESAAPTGPARLSPGSLRSRECTTRHNRDRAGAIPTSIRRDQCHAAYGRRADPASDREPYTGQLYPSDW